MSPTVRCPPTTSRPSRRCSNPLYGQQNNPARRTLDQAANPINPSLSDVFPYVFTSYRLTEHHTAGGMSRTLPLLTELQPEPFCEISPRLADERGLEHGGWATVVTARAAIEVRVLVTERMRSLRLGDRWVEQVGLPYHWGRNGITQGDSQNDLVNVHDGAERVHPGQGRDLRHPARAPASRRRPSRRTSRSTGAGPASATEQQEGEG